MSNIFLVYSSATASPSSPCFTALPTLDRNAYNVSLSFFVVNVPTELVDLTLFLERLR